MAEYIRRDAAIAEAEYDGNFVLVVPVKKIRNLPSADVIPVRHGRWMCVDTDTEQFFLCNRCKKKEYWESDYCPSCGCRMDLEG